MSILSAILISAQYLKKKFEAHNYTLSLVLLSLWITFCHWVISFHHAYSSVPADKMAPVCCIKLSLPSRHGYGWDRDPALSDCRQRDSWPRVPGRASDSLDTRVNPMDVPGNTCVQQE